MLDNSKSPKSEQQQQRTSVYEKLQHNLQNDEKWKQEISLGKRITLYKLQGEIGRGNFSQVKMAVHELTKERVAIKILDKAKLTVKARRMLDREISNMTSIHHPNIIRLFEVIESFSKLFLVMEYASGGELYQKLTAVGKLPEIDAKTIFAQILSAVKYLHQNLIIHRDLKAENVFCSSRGLVKVGDFGFSTRLANGFEEQLKTFCGSPPYAAPELFRDESYVGGPVDVWAMGVLLYFMTTGYMPFPADSIAALKRNILAGVFTVPSHLSSSCRFLIGQ
nr:PREDICTED: serine/threonine-protein kinase NIM1-like [Bemisia tabaci]XP_018906029.1 PREDICTED: serine/threonine-protein kinase NIM1-like [Bemisia tabaci]XP_018906030.1 PREDICTED: serine/threonine-protein kinase NIM1-like [Bemisia tabaci]XP_018906031.1 PREDICTED: serine/threonine-protein kinase NIM1-like [Bemisia tabaci]